ncbi:tRNA glutamyl-Q(34) synthetase GluQRS [Piscinibacterium candidicorallinum]|uniref:Glutamyl-Q tRNA(Asp) synthetase n=1 Tax=Piscinibacterium candidicorallinum TaxID=1793872 RepID=A0ABV7H1A0_9BURK
MGYVGRFAPSPTGPLHAGSIVAALASWLDARAHGGRWLVRIDDLDTQRCDPAHTRTILAQLDALQLRPDGEVTYQQARTAAYAAAFAQLEAAGHTFGCACSRKTLAESGARVGASGELVYPGTCRQGTGGREPRAWRARVGDAVVRLTDRAAGQQTEHLAETCGDFVLKRADGPYSYHLACVVDDAATGVTDVVRGADLLAVTPRQIWLATQLGLPVPRYLHVPVVLAADGQKLSKQTGAAAVDTRNAAAVLREAARHLGLGEQPGPTASELLSQTTAVWAAQWL